MKKIYTFTIALFVTLTAGAQTLIYSNNFNNGVGDATIVGNGQIEAVSDAGFGSVFHNAVSGQAIRSNYLVLNDTVFGKLQASGSRALSIAFWVNKGTAINNFWTPMFSAYAVAPAAGVNSWPMMILQSRLVPQVNCAGWTDFVDSVNVNKLNFVSTAWLDDNFWHYYTATFTDSLVKIYVDGIVQNSWKLPGTTGNTVSGLFTNGSELKYICLGGNQAWEWADVDPAYMYDDLAIYSDVLTAAQITGIMDSKITSALKQITSDNNNKLVTEEFYTTTGAKVGNEYSKIKTGIYIKKSIYSDGTVNSTKIVKMQ